MLFGLAALTVIARTIIRIYTLHRLKLDDGLLIFALLCLSVATALFYYTLPTDMLEEAIAVDTSIIIPIDLLESLVTSVKYTDTFLCMIWTCTFSVKGSFLALFRLLISNVSPWLTRYYWTVVVYVLMTWMFMICELFILCPYFGLDQGGPQTRPGKNGDIGLTLRPVKCYPENNYAKTIGLTILVSILDIVSDILSKLKDGSICTHGADKPSQLPASPYYSYARRYSRPGRSCL